jgi:hypothetical protein
MAGKRLSVSLTLNDKQFQSGLRKATRAMTKFGKSMQRTGQSLSRNLTAPIGLAGLASIKMASDFEESLNKTRVAFGESSLEVEAFAKTTLKSFGIAEGSALEMSSLFGDMATAMGLSQSEAAGMAQSLVGLAGDLASFKNIGIEQAQTALSGIFTGETESLKKLGIVLTEANLKQFGYNKTMTQSEKIAVRYRAVIEQTRSAQGDFARTSDGVANSSRVLGESIKQLSQDFGTLLLPLASKLISIFQDLTNKISSLDAEQKQFILRIAGITAVVGPLLIILGKLVTSITAVGKALIFLAANPMVVFASAVAGLVGLLGFAILDLESFIKTALSLGKVGQVVAKGIIKMASAFGGMNKMEADAALIIIDKLGEQQEKLADSMEGTTGKIEEQKESIDKLIESMGEMPTAPIGISGDGMQSTGILNFEPKAAQPVPLSEDALDTTPIESYSAGLTDLQIKMQDTANSFERAFHSMAVSADASFGDMAAAAGNAARQIIKTQIAEATAAYAAKVFSSVPFPFNLALAAAAGSVVGSLFNKIIPPFAEGGMVSGATLAMVGEGPGTSAINPEVIAPLDKLQGMIGNAGGQVEVVGKISGSDILLASDRARGNRNRTRGY